VQSANSLSKDAVPASRGDIGDIGAFDGLFWFLFLHPPPSLEDQRLGDKLKSTI